METEQLCICLLMLLCVLHKGPISAMVASCVCRGLSVLTFSSVDIDSTACLTLFFNFSNFIVHVAYCLISLCASGKRDLNWKN